MSLPAPRPAWNTPDDPITRWLLMVAALVLVMVAVGGFVRLSRAGLSIVEWDVVTGIVPPIGDTAWEQSFAEYQETPEYQLVNRGMDLDGYKRIFYIEWAHRLIGRIAGLLVVLPLAWFMWKRRLTLRASLRYWAIAALFGIQGAIGWVMVSSGLRDRPTVSDLRLVIHLMTAVAMLGIVLWMALGRLQAERLPPSSAVSARPRTSRALSWALLVVVVAQIAYGGLVAGLKAGHVSDTWPLMFGRFAPPGLLTARDPWWANLFDPVGAHWGHRWLAFIVVATAVAVAVVIRRDHPGSRLLRGATRWLLAVVATQIALGISVVVLGVPKWLALAHQSTGVTLFCVSVVITYVVRAESTARAPILAPQPA